MVWESTLLLLMATSVAVVTALGSVAGSSSSVAVVSSATVVGH